MKLGIKIKTSTKENVEVVRTTLESEIRLKLDNKSGLNQINTGIPFFNHMLDGLFSRSELYGLVTYQATKAETLDHVITEDVGLTLGRAIREILDVRQPQGVHQRGSYTVAFDEALVTMTLAFDGRAYCFFTQECEGLQTEFTEGIASTNLRQFFEGFAQGSGCAIHIQAWAGKDSHHTWEATYKAFGEALRESLAKCPFRAGKTIGLKGTGMESKL